jgi:hypothetical protein
VAAQALEVAANDVRLHGRMQVAGYNRHVIEALAEVLPKDSFAVGVRLKRNAFRELQALEEIKGTEPLGPVCQLADFPLPTVERVLSRNGTNEGPLLVCYSDMPFIESQTLRALINKHCIENAVMTLLTGSSKPPRMSYAASPGHSNQSQSLPLPSVVRPSRGGCPLEGCSARVIRDLCLCI